MQLIGLMLTKDDHPILEEWCRDQLPLYDAVVCLDGSASTASREILEAHADRVVYLHERDYPGICKTDHGLRRVVHREIVRRFGLDNWIMCCHPDEFCYHDPRKLAWKAESEGFDGVAWFSLHFLPHPEDWQTWEQTASQRWTNRIRHYHWDYQGTGLPWQEFRLYRNGPRVAWDRETHSSTQPHHLESVAHFHGILKHYKVVTLDPSWYDSAGGQAAYFKTHWDSLPQRTGLAFPVKKLQDLFVASYPGYGRCDLLQESIPHSWNMGEEYRAETMDTESSPGLENGDAAMSRRRPSKRPQTNSLEALYGQAQSLAERGRYEDAEAVYAQLEARELPGPLKARLENDRAMISCVRGDFRTATERLRTALALDEHCQAARTNLRVLEAQAMFEQGPVARPAQWSAMTSAVTGQTPKSKGRIAVLSFLFNWPSTGGGIVHTLELADFLIRAGFEVKHFYARNLPWGVGNVQKPLKFPSEPLDFDADSWKLTMIKERYREVIDGFNPDHVIITDSWNMKPHLADAIRGYPYIMRLQAMECICPLNNSRLLIEPGGRVRQCGLQQLATPNDCHKCVVQRGHLSGDLHRDERALAGVGTPEYDAILRRAFREAEAVYVVNKEHQTMLSPYSDNVRVVTAGMDPARFPTPKRSAQRKGRTVVLFAGVVQELMKGFHVLHEACARLWQKRQDFELVATGEPAGQVDPFTRFVGWQSQQTLPGHLEQADVLVFPSIAQEALGRTIVEGMAAGIPVIASRLGGLPYTLLEGATGLLAEPNDPDDLASKIEQLLDDPELRQRLGQAGRKRFEEHYSWPVIIERHYLPLFNGKK